MERFLKMWRSMKPRYQWAIGIALVVTAWLATGLIFHPNSGGQDTAKANTDVTPLV